MKIDHEELLARNPALMASAFWHVAQRHAGKAHGAPPILPIFVVSAALLLHRATVDKVHGMNFDSGFLKAVVERPDLLAGLQRRVEAHADTAPGSKVSVRGSKRTSSGQMMISRMKSFMGQNSMFSCRWAASKPSMANQVPSRLAALRT